MGMQLAFMSHVINDDNQADYLIDPYFYMHLGEKVAQDSVVSHKSFLALSDEYKPNAESQGIVLINAWLYILLPSWYCLPFVFGLIYASLFYFLYRLRLFNRYLLWFPFYSLYLHIFLPSKETFLFIGFILMLISVLRGRYWILGLVGIGLMFLARPSAALIFIISLLIWMCTRSRIGSYVVTILLAALYLLVLRAPIFAYSLREQIVGSYGDMTGDVVFCSVGPLSVCYGSQKAFELIVIQRIATLSFLPFKWLWNAIQLFYQDYGRLVVIATYHRLSLVLHCGLALFILRANRRASISGARVRKMMYVFIAVYIGLFCTLIYYQPTRQVLLASCFILLTISITSEHGDRESIASQPGPSRQFGRAAS